MKKQSFTNDNHSSGENAHGSLSQRSPGRPDVESSGKSHGLSHGVSTDSGGASFTTHRMEQSAGGRLPPRR